MAKILRGLLFAAALIFTQSTNADAQCPMCRTSLESNLKNGGTMGKGINKGIFMLFIMPYILVGGLGYVWFKNRKDRNEQDIESEIVEIA